MASQAQAKGEDNPENTLLQDHPYVPTRPLLLIAYDRGTFEEANEAVGQGRAGRCVFSSDAHKALLHLHADTPNSQSWVNTGPFFARSSLLKPQPSNIHFQAPRNLTTGPSSCIHP